MIVVSAVAIHSNLPSKKKEALIEYQNGKTTFIAKL